MQKYGLTMIAAVAALAIASSASAATNTILRITGSTAYRSVVHNAIKAMITPGSLKYGYTGTSFTGAGAAEFTGALISSPNTTVDVKTVWSGSVDGIQRIQNQGSASFNVTTWLASGSLSSTGTPSLATGSEVAPANAAMSDVFQLSTIFQTPTIDNDVIVGVIPFQWCRNNGAPITLNNMTSLLAQQVLSAGSLTLKCWTANPADESTLVRVVGRNFDSGTRVTAFAETGFGVGSPPNQSEAFLNGTVITNLAPYHAETLLGQSFSAGQSGYSSGGTVAGVLNATGSNAATNSGNKGWLVGYLGVSDAAGVTNGTATQLTYNGVAYTPAAVENGQYTFWGYEHLYFNNNLAADVVTAVNAIESSLTTTDPSPGGIPLASMTVGRTQEGAPVTDGRAF